MNHSNRAKRIKAFVDSQSLAAQAVSLYRAAALIALDGVGNAVVPSRTAASAVRTIRLVAEKIEEEARLLCKEEGIELPPDTEATITGAKGAK